MAADFAYLDENYHVVMETIKEAQAKYRSPKEAVTCMAVTKTVPATAVNHVIGLGISVLGENRVQEYLSKKDEYLPGPAIHFIGHLQTNKVKQILPDMALIESVDSAHLAHEIGKHAERCGKVQDILVEVNVGGEESKSGVAPSELENLLQTLAQMPYIHVRGLMTVPPITTNDKFLARMQEIFLDISEKRIDNIDMQILSMGMSGDYVLAIRHGSNLVRIGTALFGPRHYG